MHTKAPKTQDLSRPGGCLEGTAKSLAADREQAYSERAYSEQAREAAAAVPIIHRSFLQAVAQTWLFL